MTLRPATRADLPHVEALERAVFGAEAYPGFFFRQAFDLWPPLFRVADAGVLTGYALGAPAATGETGWLLSLAVAPARRGSGTGAALLHDVLAAFAAAGLDHVRLTVHPDNPAVRLYERAGFVVLAEEADYFGPGEARLLMQARVRQS